MRDQPLSTRQLDIHPLSTEGDRRSRWSPLGSLSGRTNQTRNFSSNLHPVSVRRLTPHTHHPHPENRPSNSGYRKFRNQRTGTRVDREGIHPPHLSFKGLRKGTLPSFIYERNPGLLRKWGFHTYTPPSHPGISRPRTKTHSGYTNHPPRHTLTCPVLLCIVPTPRLLRVSSREVRRP